MIQPNPATPAPAATPGSNEPVQPTPSADPSKPTGTGDKPEGQVTIPTKEYAQLQRDAARVRSADRRGRIGRGNQPAANDLPVDEAVQQERTARIEAEQRAFRSDVKAGVRDILDKPEYASIPKSTRELILKNPASLSESNDVEEALLDIEDFLIEQASFEKGNPNPIKVENRSPQPAGTETPPKPGGGGPETIPGTADEEDVSKLRGSDRTRAMIRNKTRGMKK